MKNILIITQKVNINDPILGFFHAWIIEFSKHFKRVYVICLETGEYQLPSNVEVFSLGKESGGNKITYVLKFFYYLVKLHGKYKNVFVHMNQIYVVLAGLWWKVTGKKIGLWYAHGAVSTSLSLAEKFSDIIFTSTEAGFKLPSKKIKIVGQGIDVDVFKPKEGKSWGNKIITTGRISRIKNYKNILLIADCLKKEGFDFSLDIVGGPVTSDDEKYFEELKLENVELGLGGTVCFLGSKTQKEILEFLQNADLFLNTSENKSLDKAIVEAMSVGLPIVSSNESFWLITKNESLFFKRGDIKDAYIKIKGILGLSGEDKKKLADSMRGIVKKSHSLSGLISRIKTYYE